MSSERTRIKICCIKDAAEVRMALDAGADALGFVSAMPSGPGPIAEGTIAELVPLVPDGVATFLLTSLQQPDAIIDQQRRLGADTVQICDALAPGGHAALRAGLPGVHLVQVIHVTGEAAVKDALAVAAHVDALLLDSGNAALATKQLGGTGRTHDWALSRAIRAAVSVPVWLAGGLCPDNVGAAIGAVRPHGVDLCSGLRVAGRLDAALLGAFVAAVRATDRTGDRGDRSAPAV